jgi:hypothetical protein
MPRTARGVVYWLFNARCICPWRHGYIGMTVDWPHRMYRHRSESEFPVTDFQGRVLFEGTIKQCLAFEQRLRPVAGIGWNKYPGGRAGHAGKGVPKSDEWKAKVRAAALRRYADPAERLRTSKQVKLGIKFKKRDYSGAKNPNYGKLTSEAAKQKMRDKLTERGGVTGENNPNYKHGRYTE